MGKRKKSASAQTPQIFRTLEKILRKWKTDELLWTAPKTWKKKICLSFLQFIFNSKLKTGSDISRSLGYFRNCLAKTLIKTAILIQKTAESSLLVKILEFLHVLVLHVSCRFSSGTTKRKRLLLTFKPSKPGNSIEFYSNFK